jgi:hypothetical protein
VRKSKFLKAISLLIVAALCIPSVASSQTVNPVAFDVVYLYDVDEGAEAFCALSPVNSPFQVGSKIQAAASLTVTAVSGTPFESVSVGDQLLVTNSDGTPYRLAVSTRASGTSITVAGIDNNTGSLLASLTLTNASFVYRKLSCGTGINDGVMDVSRIRNKVFEGFISASSLSSGNLQMRVQCRTAPGSPWLQMVPALTPPAITPTYYGWATGVLGVFAGTTIDGFGQCRVGFSLSGTDTGADDLASVSLSGIS